MKKSYGELQGTGCREGMVRGKGRRGPGKGPFWGSVLRKLALLYLSYSGEWLRNLLEEDFSPELTVPSHGKHESSIAHVNSPWI